MLAKLKRPVPISLVGRMKKMRILETKLDEEEYTRFLESNERCNYTIC